MKNEVLNLRWDPYLLIKNGEYNSFWKNHLKNEKGKVLFIMGKGFDLRMNLALQRICETNPNCKIECLLIEFDEGKNSPSIKYKDFVAANIEELKEIINGHGEIKNKKINLWINDHGKKRRISSREASNIFNDFKSLQEFTDIIVDVSSLPRGIYFSLIGKLLYLLDKNDPTSKINFFILAAENAAMDSLIKETGIDEDIDYLTGFGGRIDLETDSPIIWFPILGEDKKAYIQRAYTFINPSELCPILPFPAKNPRRGDKLIADYHDLLFDELRVEAQNIMYVSEQNPFDTYRKLSQVIKHYKRSMQVLGDCKTAISTFSSKLLSIGALIAAYEFNYCDPPLKGVGVVNVDCLGYEIDNLELFKNLKSESELFVIWLAGYPYVK
jgi:hypothetical protein